MAIKNSRLFGLSVSLSLSDTLDKKQCLRNLRLNPEDLEVIRGISDTGFGKDDLQTLSSLSTPIWRSFDRYYSDVLTYKGTLLDSGGIDYQLGGNLKVSGAVSSTAFRYPVIDMEPYVLNPSSDLPILKWGDISTSRISSWSTIGNSISYGANVDIGGTLSVAKIKTRTKAQPIEFSAETATHKLKFNINGVDRYVYAMKGIPLTFKAYYRNISAFVDAIEVNSIPKISWRLRRTDGSGFVDFKDHDGPGGGVDNGVIRSQLDYRSPSAKENFIEIYYPPSGYKTLSMENLNIIEIPKIKLENLETLNLANNGLRDFFDVSFFAPNLKNLNLSRNVFYYSSNKEERKLNDNIKNKLPSTLESIYLQGCFRGGLTQGVFEKFVNLKTLSIPRFESARFYPDSDNPTGELPLFSSNQNLESINLTDNDFRTITPGNGSSNYSILEQQNISTINLYGNRNLTGSFGVTSNSITSIDIGRTKLFFPITLQGSGTLRSFKAFENSQSATSLYKLDSQTNIWDGGDDNVPSSDANYIFSNCSSMIELRLHGSKFSGFIPKFDGNQDLSTITLTNLYNIKNGRPGKTDAKALYEDTFESATSVTDFRLNSRSPNYGGEIEKETFTPLKDSLKFLTLRSYPNRFTGEFPNLDECKKIVEVDSAYQSWTGNLPSFASATWTLKKVYLNNNDFDGSLDWNGKRITELNLANNKLTSVGSNFSLRSMNYLNLSNNLLTGNFPNFTNSCPYLINLYMYGNEYTLYNRNGGLNGLFHLRRLDLSNNNFDVNSIDNILFDLKENYDAKNRNRRLYINLRGNAAPSPYPLITGIVNGVGAIEQPTIDNTGLITSLGSNILTTIPSGYAPVNQSYDVEFDTDGSGQSFKATLQLQGSFYENVILTLGTPTLQDINLDFVAGEYTDENGTVIITVTESNGSYDVSLSSNNTIDSRSGYSTEDTILLTYSYTDDNGDNQTNTMQVPISTIRNKYYTSASYTLTLNSSTGGYGYQEDDKLLTQSNLRFENQTGEVINGQLQLEVTSTTEVVDTSDTSVGQSVVEYLRKKGWTISVDN